MLRLRSFLFVAALLPGLPIGAEEEALLLYREDYEPPDGTTVETKSTMRMFSEKMSIVVGDQELDATMKSNKSEEVEMVWVNSDRVRRTIQESSSKHAMTINGREIPQQEEEEALTGHPVILEMKEGEWRARLEEGKPTKEQREELEKLEGKWNDDEGTPEGEVLYGDQLRRIGESWQTQADDLLGIIDGEVEVEVEMTLLGVGEYMGLRCARLEGELEAVGFVRGKGDDPDMKMKMEGTVRILRSLDYFCDVKVDLEGRIELTATSPSPAGPMTLSVRGPMVLTERVAIRE